MAEVRLYLDEDAGYPDRLRALRRNGFDVETAVEAGMLGRTDPEHLAYATASGRVLVSHNIGDYSALHSMYLGAGAAHSGIILIAQQQYSAGEILRRIQRLAAALGDEGMANRLDFLNT